MENVVKQIGALILLRLNPLHLYLPSIVKTTNAAGWDLSRVAHLGSEILEMRQVWKKSKEAPPRSVLCAMLFQVSHRHQPGLLSQPVLEF